jgi:hypothetical protein
MNDGLMGSEFKWWVLGSFKRSWRHFICEKYKTIQLFKLHFLQNRPLVQLHTSSSDCKGVGNNPGSHFMKAFSPLPLHYQ